VEQKLKAMQEQISAMGKRIGQLEAALEKKNTPDRTDTLGKSQSLTHPHR
jgi:hypothetical protein